MNYDYQGMGFRIAAERKKKNLTQAELAEKLGVSAQAISKWETGMGYPDLSILPEIAASLDFTMDELFGVKLVPEKEIKERRDRDLPEHFQGLSWVATYGDKVLYASDPEATIQLPEVLFKDGSTVDMASGTILNYGQNIRLINKAELRDYPQKTTKEDSKESKTKEIVDFTKLLFDLRVGTIDVLLIHDPKRSYGWTIEGNPEQVKNLDIGVDDGTLRVGLKERLKRNSFFGFSRVNFSHFTKGSRLMVNCPLPKMDELKILSSGCPNFDVQVDVQSIDLKLGGAGEFRFKHADDFTCKTAGACEAFVETAENVAISSAGASDITISKLLGGVFKCTIAGAGDVHCGGHASLANIQLAGAGDLKGKDLRCEHLECLISGPSTCTIGRVVGTSKERVFAMGSLRILARGAE